MSMSMSVIASRLQCLVPGFSFFFHLQLAYGEYGRLLIAFADLWKALVPSKTWATSCFYWKSKVGKAATLESKILELIGILTMRFWSTRSWLFSALVYWLLPEDEFLYFLAGKHLLIFSFPGTTSPSWSSTLALKMQVIQLYFFWSWVL